MKQLWIEGGQEFHVFFAGGIFIVDGVLTIEGF